MMRYLLFLVLTLPGVLYAGGSHERARELVEQGAIMPLEQLIAQVQQEHDWRLLEAELEEEGQRIIYEIEWLDPQGRVHKIHYDANNGAVIAEEIDN